MSGICLLKYTRADSHVKHHDALPLLEYMGHLPEVGLDTDPVGCRRPRTLLSWTSAVMNSPTGGPELAQIVTVRDIGEEAQIAHLELTDQARAIVGHELGIHRDP